MSGKVLLTGAAGFVGRQVLHHLNAAQIPVRAVIRKGSRVEGTAETIETSDLFSETANWWAEASDGIHTVIHVAWYAKPGLYLQSPENLVCLEGTLTMARGCAQAGVRRFVGVGTCFEYDLSAEKLLLPDMPLRPTTVYAGAKVAAFFALKHWLPSQGVSFAWCRLFYLFGEGEPDGRLVPYLRARLSAGVPAELSDGEQVRDYLDVREAGRLIVAAALGSDEGPINICSGVSTTVRELAGRIADEYGRRDLLAFGARPHNPLDPSYVVGRPGR
jgi:nucleoside-diphosphate-sugar epimerase